MLLKARSRMLDCSSLSVAAKNSSCFSGSRVLKECAHQLSLMRFLLFIFLHFLLQVISCKKEKMKMAQPGLFLGLIKTICWDMGTKPLRSLRLSRVLNLGLPFCGCSPKTWFLFYVLSIH